MAAPKAPTAPRNTVSDNANPNTPAAGAAPAAGTDGQPVVKAKREPIKRVTHPALKPDDKGVPTCKLDVWPADYSSVKHKALRREDFTSEAVMLNEQARVYEEKAKKLRQEAIDCATLGGTEARKQVKQVRDIIGKLAELTGNLKAKGINMEEMLGGLQAMLTKQEATPAKVEGEAAKATA